MGSDDHANTYSPRAIHSPRLRAENRGYARCQSQEEKRWNPAHWKSGRLKSFLLHTYKHAKWACCEIVGPHDGRILVAQLQAEQNDRKSAALLRAAGVQTIGGVHE